MSNDNRPIMVTIRCITYNQERYIRECLEGFVMQQTDFRFEALVHDDASTDGTANIIREYELKYPDIIKPIYETENQFSKHDGSLARIMDEKTHGKYVAICEGDDYWNDPTKLQKQFDFMESHPECSLCFHSDYHLKPNGEWYLHRPKQIKEFYSIEHVLLGGGGFMATNTMFYRWEYIRKEGRPDFWKNCPIGDMPNMLFLGTKGRIGYIDSPMSTYRLAAMGSWTLRQNSMRNIIRHHKAIIKMFNEFDTYTDFRHHIVIKKKLRKNNIQLFKTILVLYVRRIKKYFK